MHKLYDIMDVNVICKEQFRCCRKYKQDSKVGEGDPELRDRGPGSGSVMVGCVTLKESLTLSGP